VADLINFMAPGRLDVLLRTRLLVQANSGGGKSRALRSLLEQTHGQVLQIVLDPEGEFATLREHFPFVLAGKDADVAVHPKTARTLCRRLLEEGASAVVDLFDLALSERREFVKLFLTELMTLPRTLWRPALIVLDEAHLFAPERGSGEAQSTDSVIALCTQGRKRGFCAVLATQRISKLHKDAAAELLNKLIGRTGLDVDMKRAGDELGMDRERRMTLRDLKPGEFLAFGPMFGAGVHAMQSAPVRTTHPDASTGPALPVPRPSANVQAIIARLGDIPQIAAKEQQDLTALQQQVRRLEGELRQARAGTAQPDHTAIQRAVDDAVQVAEMAAAQRFNNQVNGMRERIASAVVALRSYVDALDAAIPHEAPPATYRVALEKERPVRPAPRPVAAPKPVAQAGLSGVQQKIVNTLAGFAQLGVTAPDKATVAAMCDYHPNAKSYSNAMGALRSAGYVEYPTGGRLSLTDAGAAIATAALPVESRADLHRLWIDKLGGVAGRILVPLLAAYPHSLATDVVAEQAGYHPNAKSFSNMKGRLKTLGLIAYPRPGELAATPLLFPEGLP
jgi:uncharacterized protein